MMEGEESNAKFVKRLIFIISDVEKKRNAIDIDVRIN